MCLRLPSTEEQRAAEPGNKSGQRIAEDTLTSDAAYLARSTGAITEQALAFAREHVGLTMIDALSLFKRQLVDQAHRRAQQAADSLRSNAGETARRTSGCVVTTRASYQYRPDSPSKKKKKKKAEVLPFDDDSVYML